MVTGELAFVAWDRHPVNPGHFLVIPFRHVASYFEITDSERIEMWSLVEAGRQIAEEQFQPDGYNVGINVGQWAGQSIHHVHTVATWKIPKGVYVASYRLEKPTC